MAVEQKIKAVLQGAELVFELALIEPTRYGPIIHANVPDYAEILMKIFIEERGGNTKNKNFHDLIQDIVNNPKNINLVRFQKISDYFVTIREQFRNPLHHTDKVQGYVIAKAVALECLLSFDELLWILFPALSSSAFNNTNYPCYVRFIKMDYDENTGNGDHSLYSKVIQALNKMEKFDNHRCPKDFDAARVLSIRRLFHLDEETFSLRVLGYRRTLPEKIIDLLSNSVRPVGSKRITDLIKNDPVFSGIRKREIEFCLQHIQGERISPRGIVLIQGGAYYLAN
jgi:hypothetical protein